MPDPLLVGRNAEKIEALARANGIARWGTNLDAALAGREDTVFFDAGTTQMRPQLLAQALRAGKHVYCEKPIATNLDAAIEIARLAQASGLKNGAVQDKLFLPACASSTCCAAPAFGRMLRFASSSATASGGRPATDPAAVGNCSEEGGGMILDMMCHWRYVPTTCSEVQSISCLGATHPGSAGTKRQALRRDRRRRCLRDRAAEGPPGRAGDAQLNMSWATRVRRDDLVTFHVDGTDGSAVAGLHDCQSKVATPRPVWNPDVKQPMSFHAQWQESDSMVYDNGQDPVEHFIRHVAEDAPYQ
jgi:predicted dehydrogenase